MEHKKRKISTIIVNFGRVLDIRGAYYILRNSRNPDYTVINRANDMVGSSWRTIGSEIQNAFAIVKYGKG